MKLIGALAAFVFFFYGVGLMMGRAPTVRLGLGSDANKPEVSKRQIWLTQAGLDLKPAQYYGGIGLIAVIAFAIVSAITATPAAAFAPAVIAAVVPHTFFGRRRHANLTKTQQAWPDAIREITASIESNASLQGALVQLSYRGPESLRKAFDRFPMLSSTVGVVPALESVRERLSDPTSDRIIEILILAHERGGGIVTDILRDLAHTTTDDLQLLEEIETSQLEQKINARAVFVLPWIVLIILVTSNHNFRTFYHSAAGYGVIAIGAFFSMLGMIVLNKLGKDVPEPRVFGGSAVSRPEEASTQVSTNQ